MPCCAASPVAVDADVDGNGQYLEKLSKAMKNFDSNVTDTLTLFQQLIKSYEKVAVSFEEASAESDMGIQTSIRDLKGEMVRLKDGEAISTLQMGILHKVREQAQHVKVKRESANKIYKSLVDTKMSYESQRSKMAKIEKKYADNSKPLTESSSYLKAKKKREELEVKYNEKKKEFLTAMATLKKQVSIFLVNAAPGYVSTVGEFSTHLGIVLMKAVSNLSTLAPLGEPMHECRAEAAGNGVTSPHKAQTSSLEEEYYKSVE